MLYQVREKERLKKIQKAVKSVEGEDDHGADRKKFL